MCLYLSPKLMQSPFLNGKDEHRYDGDFENTESKAHMPVSASHQRQQVTNQCPWKRTFSYWNCTPARNSEWCHHPQMSELSSTYKTRSWTHHERSSRKSSPSTNHGIKLLSWSVVATSASSLFSGRNPSVNER